MAAQQSSAEAELLPSRDELFDQELAENAATEKFGAVNE
jgi:hypothetical protein